MDYLYMGLASAVSIFFFALSVRSGRKNSIVAGLIGAASYVLYMLLSRRLSEVGAVFFATLFGCICAETVARIMKAPATVFSIPIIIPLVPGLMLYRTMLSFGQGDNSGGVDGAVSTLLVAGSMSLAVTLATLAARLVTEAQHKHKNKQNG
ncbi:MAG: threonine/serine exporter family protein [Clostridia bacterium]|nr:threonine/serine exporter family protein [Clostridia bacterium]